MRQQMSSAELLEFIREQQGDKSLSKFASDIGTSVAYISDIYNNKRTPGPKVLTALNVAKTTTYQVISKPKTKKSRRWK